MLRPQSLHADHEPSEGRPACDTRHMLPRRPKGGYLSMRAFRPLQHISMWGIWLDLMFNIPPKDAPTEAPEKSKDL